MTMQFIPMGSSDIQDVIEFLTANRFPYHVRSEWTEEQAAMTVRNGRFWNDSSQGYWIVDGQKRLGIVSLEDDVPMFDLRLSEEKRGLGYGVKILEALTDKVFTEMTDVVRFEGQTREDNLPMRRTFVKAGFLKEAHYRMGWPMGDGQFVSSVAYSMIRPDWKSGKTTEFIWDDLS
ncbi:GNAT family protein [Glutamicibacter ectropisis]|uniref:GNAT family protein n=1 Tax=Glutamicibacter ectropisis TaxID=3046593 RepID=A0AAU6WFG3_9MICC